MLHELIPSHTSSTFKEFLRARFVRRAEDSERGSVYPKAFSQLASEIHRTIHVLDVNPGDGKFVSMPDLCKQYVTALNEQGLSDIQIYRADCLKLRLQQPLGGALRWCSFGAQSEWRTLNLLFLSLFPGNFSWSMLLKWCTPRHASFRTGRQTDDLNFDLSNLAEPGDDHPQVSSCSAIEDIASVELFNSASTYIANCWPWKVASRLCRLPKTRWTTHLQCPMYCTTV